MHSKYCTPDVVPNLIKPKYLRRKLYRVFQNPCNKYCTPDVVPNLIKPKYLRRKLYRVFQNPCNTTLICSKRIA